MLNPLVQLKTWIEEERLAGNRFSHGAVLGTVGTSGIPHTRMLGVHFDARHYPRFHTSPTSRKVIDIEHNQQASLTFAFQTSLRSVSLEGSLVTLTSEQLDADWLALEPDFRRSYLIFGETSGQVIDSNEALEQRLEILPPAAELLRPIYFIGYRFAEIQRVAFYSVSDKAFAEHEVWSIDIESNQWIKHTVAP